MSDAWDEIQAIKSKRNSLREKLEKRKKERQDIFGVTTLISVVGPQVIGNNATVKIDSIDDSAIVSLKLEIGDSDSDVEKTILQMLSNNSVLLPINSVQLTAKIERLLERIVSRDSVHYILKKLASQSIVGIKSVTIKGETGFELILVDHNAVQSLYNRFITDNTFSKVENKFKRKHESEEDDDENSRKSCKSEKKVINNTESNKTSDIMSLLSMPSTREKQSKQVGEEILELLTKPTAKERSLAEKFKSHGGAQVMEFCPHGTRVECLRAQQTTVEMSSTVNRNRHRRKFKILINTASIATTSENDDENNNIDDDDNNIDDDDNNIDDEDGDIDNENNAKNDETGEIIVNDDGNNSSSNGISIINNMNHPNIKKIQSNADEDDTDSYDNNGGKSNIHNGIINYETAVVRTTVKTATETDVLEEIIDSDEEQDKAVNENCNNSKEKMNSINIDTVTMPRTPRRNKDNENNEVMDKCRKLHFKKIIQGHTDESLGDCSFLNTCFHMTTCKYVHYEVDMSSNSSNNSRHDDVKSYSNAFVKSTTDPSATLYPPQWIQCDLRYLDMTVLGKFAVVMADPPWDIHMELPYGTMSDDEMRQLGVPALQDDGLIFLWVTGRAMELGRECLKLWGYERVDELIWVKTNQLQRIIRTGRTGHWLNHGKEHCLVGMKGNPKNLNRGLDCDVIVAEVRATSHKPDEIYGIIERLSPGTRKIELFGRPHNVQPNWITLGNQLDGIRLVDPELIAQFQKRYPDGNCMAPTSKVKK